MLERGTEGLARVVERFGPGVLLADGALDRTGLAAVVFTDGSALADLNAIVHPAVATLMAERLASLAGTDEIVVLDIPLLAEGHGRDRHDMAGVLVVDAPVDLAVERLVTSRGMDRDDAELRVAAQATREQRLAVADFVIVNMGTLAELAIMVDRAWAWMCSLRGAAG